MKPYYEDESVTLYHGDCREILPQLGKDAADLIVTDPPYEIEYQSNRGNHAKIEGDDGTLDIQECLTAACRTLRRSRHAYIFGGGPLDRTPLAAAVELVWDKQIVGMGDLSLPWSKSHEPITFAVYEPSKANRDKGYGGLAARIRQGSVLSVQRVTGGASLRHPTEKPVLLLRQLIESSSVMGEVILDPFAGVHSTGVAAVLEGRRYIGIELDERYCEAGALRFQKGATGQAAFDFGDAS